MTTLLYICILSLAISIIAYCVKHKKLQTSINSTQINESPQTSNKTSTKAASNTNQQCYEQNQREAMSIEDETLLTMTAIAVVDSISYQNSTSGNSPSHSYYSSSDSYSSSSDYSSSSSSSSCD